MYALHACILRLTLRSWLITFNVEGIILYPFKLQAQCIEPAFFLLAFGGDTDLELDLE